MFAQRTLFKFTELMLMIFVGTGSGVNIMGRAEGGQIKNGQKVLVMPAAVQGQAKSISVHGEPADWAQAGDHVTLSLHGLDMVNITYVYYNLRFCYCDTCGAHLQNMHVSSSWKYKALHQKLNKFHSVYQFGILEVFLC